MATRKLLNPPVLTDVDSIDTWLRDLQIWKYVTDLEKKHQGPVIYLSLPDKVRNSCRNISITDLGKDNGLDTLINNLERLYLKDKKASAYLMKSLIHLKDPLKWILLTILMNLNECTMKFSDTKWHFQQPYISNGKQQLARAK